MSNEIVAKINARELTVREIRDVMKAADAGNLQLGMIDLLFPDGMPGAVVQTSTGLTEEQLGAMTPSELAEVVEAVKTANPLYAAHLARMRQIIRAAQPA